VDGISENLNWTKRNPLDECEFKEVLAGIKAERNAQKILEKELLTYTPTFAPIIPIT
jgi:hypothetical protein